jgi:alpha-1,2-mannosyltransferase
LGVVSHADGPRGGLVGALHQLRDPLAFGIFPVVVGVLIIVWGWLPAWGIGFDFVGTLWEPARALLDGDPIYPAPVRASILVGNPSVYPPTAIVASTPLALLPQAAAAWLWFAVLGASLVAALRILGVRDWRCYVLAVMTPFVIQGTVFGNLTVLLVLVLALAWRYRDEARIAGTVIGAGVAMKFVVWPLIVWLVVTRRFRAAGLAVACAVVLVFGTWAVLGFQGMTAYPHLLGELEKVYATRSISLATIAAGFGASLSVAVSVCWLAGALLLGGAAWVARRADGDRRAFTLCVAACVVASPIVWSSNAAFLLVPVAIAWPSLSPVWLFGYAIWLVGAIVPDMVVERGACCRPEGVPEQAWLQNHAHPWTWYAVGVNSILVLVALFTSARVRAATPRMRLEEAKA